MKKLLFSLLVTLCIISSMSFFTAISSHAQNNSEEVFIEEKAKIIQIKEKEEHIKLYTIEILSGEFSGQQFHIEEDTSIGYWYDNLEEGDNVSVYGEFIDAQPFFSIKGRWYIDKIIFWIGVLIFCIILLARKEGIKNILSLGLSFFLMFSVFIYLISQGYSPLVVSLIISIIVAFVSIFILSGWTKKSFASIIGTIGGVIVAVLFSSLIIWSMQLSGMGEENTIILFMNFPELNIQGIFLSGIILGALGATMDTSISISAGMQEIITNTPQISKTKLFQSGWKIGMDIIGSMLHTLIFAYIGSSLTLILLFSLTNSSLISILNTPYIAEEIVRSISGSMGLIAAIPITAFVKAKLY